MVSNSTIAAARYPPQAFRLPASPFYKAQHCDLGNRSMEWLGFAGFGALVAGAAVGPLWMALSHGEFVGQRQPPKWARPVFRLVACLAVAWCGWEFVSSRMRGLSDLETSDDIALALGTIALVAGACCAAIVALQEHREKERDPVVED